MGLEKSPYLNARRGNLFKIPLQAEKPAYYEVFFSVVKIGFHRDFHYVFLIFFYLFVI